MTDSPYNVSTEHPPAKSPSSWIILSNIVTTPEKAFKDMQADYPVLFPLFTLILLNIAMMALLFANMDFQWYVDYMVEATAGDASKAEQDQVRQGLEMFGSTGLAGIAILGAAIGIPIIFCLFALYFMIISSVRNDGFQFKQWFSFVSWTSIPSLIGVFAAIVVIMTSSDGQLAPEKLNPLSLNELFFGMNAVQGVGNILASTDLTMIWTVALMTIGYAKWTQSSYAKSFATIIAPYVVLFGVRFLIA